MNMLITEILKSMATLFLLIVPGFFFKKFNMITENQSKGVNEVACNLTLPCLIISAMQIPLEDGMLKECGIMFIIFMLLLEVLLVIGLGASRPASAFRRSASRRSAARRRSR